MNIIYTLVAVIVLGLFLYFGYKDDYKNNPKMFIGSLIFALAIVAIFAIEYFVLH